MKGIVDAIGTTHAVEIRRTKLVSLVPSTTETLFALGAGEAIRGVTRYCVHPDQARDLPSVGGTKSPHVESIVAMSPDLVVANKEENRQEDIDALTRHVPVLVAYPLSVDDAVKDIRELGTLVGRPEQGESIASSIEKLRPARPSRSSFRYLYLIWQKPYMVAGPETFIASLLAEAGGVNVAPQGSRYPEMTRETMEAARPDVVFLSSEPFPFTEEHVDAIGSELSGTSVRLVDGELLSWHGVRLREALPYLDELAKLVTSA